MAGKGHLVAKPALGTKRICLGCAAKFYDLDKDPIVCPTCETVFVIPKPAPARGGRALRAAQRVRSEGPARQAMGTLKEADAPDVADDAEEKEDAEVVGIADVEDEATGPRMPAASRCSKSSTRSNERVRRGAVPVVRRLLRLFGRLAALRARDRSGDRGDPARLRR